MSTTHLASATRQVGDMSLILPSGSKLWAESARDGSIFPVADQYFVCYETSQSVMNRAGVAIADTNARPVAFNRTTNNTQNSLLTTFVGGGANPFVTHGVYRYNANTLTNSATRGWNTTDPYSFRCGPCQRVGLFVDGANFTLITAYAAASGAQPYYAHAVTGAISGNMSIAGILSTTGSLLVGRQNATDTTARSTFIAGLYMGAAMSGVTFTDLKLHTDLERLRLLVDPHGKLSEIQSGLEHRRSFDFYSGGQRQQNEGDIVAGDELRCIHSGAVLTFYQDASPTAVAEHREAYCPLSQKFEHRTSAVADPHGRQVGDVVFTGGHYGNSNNQLENAIDRRDPGTGYRIAPSILLPPILYRQDATTGAAIAGGAYYHAVAAIQSENHQDIVLAHDPVGARLVAKVGYHSDLTAPGVPSAGQITLDTGGIWVLRDGALPKPANINFHGETGFNRTNSYGAAAVDATGNVFFAVRCAETSQGRIRIVKVAADDTNTSRLVTGIANNAVDAGYPVDLVAMDDGTMLACYAVRADAAQGFVGPAVIAFTPAEFDSAVTGWYAARTGENIAAMTPNVSWARQSLFPIPCPARTALDLYANNGTLPVAANWAYDLQPAPACFFKHTEGGREFIGILCGKHDDPDRNGGTFVPEQSGNNREVGLSLSVFWWDGATKTLRFLRELDLFPAKRRAAAATSGPSTIVGNRDYNWALSQVLVNRGARAIIAVPRSDGFNYTPDATGWALGGLGKSIGCIDVQNWHRPDYTIDGYGPILESAPYGAATLLARPLSGMVVELQLTKAGAPGSLTGGGQSSCFTRYQTLGLNSLLPKITNPQSTNRFDV